MLRSIDTNLLLYAFSDSAPEHSKAHSFLLEWSEREDVALCEFVLMEFYQLLRNPAVLDQALSASEATEVIQRYRNHPRWRILGFPPDSNAFHHNIWHIAASPGISRRALFDARIALTLRAFGVESFATANTRDFQTYGFKSVINPLSLSQ